MIVGFLTAMATMLGAGMFGAPALAADGRGVDPAGELAAYYTHALGRDIDQVGRDTYLPRMASDCRRGTLEAAYTIMTSPEAVERWGGNPSDLAGALYAGLLDRAPEAEGLQTYTASIAARGMNWATTEMLASPEYSRRLETLCSGLPSSNSGMLRWSDAVSYVDNALIPAARGAATACGVDAVASLDVGKLGEVLELAGGAPPEATEADPKPKDTRSKTRRALGAFGKKLGGPVVELSQKADEHLLNGTGGERECKTAVTYLDAAKRITEIAASELDGPTGGDNAIFLSQTVTETGWTVSADRFLQKFDLDIGPTPTDHTRFSGEFRDKSLVLGPLSISG